MRLVHKLTIGRHTNTRGFTLIEVMVVVTLIAIIAALGVVAIRPADWGNHVRGTADMVQWNFDYARAKAMASQRVHRVTFEPGNIVIQKSTDEGMITPQFLTSVKEVRLNPNIEVAGINATTEIAEGAAPSGFEITFFDFFPDGTASPGTVFLQKADMRGTPEYAKVVVFRASGTSKALEIW